MHLKRLEIYGFKSFAAKSVLDFDHAGTKSQVTAVVGPNGSGKSNVADAIRWVLGEQSTKLLRSKKNEDVIFAGSESKSRGSYAEVTLVLTDNKPFKVEINGKPFEMGEIEIGRKLYRSGESEYLINRRKVRLIDLQQLLASLGFGQSSYTVIGQGMVDRLLFFNPAERKVLFDEAAGVKQYEIKREQAVRKLESTDGNLIRLKDILTELEPRVVNLRRLVKRAEGRVEIEAELAEIQQKYYGSVAFEYKSKLENLEKEKQELNKKIVQETEKINLLDKKIDEIRAKNENATALEAIERELSEKTASRDVLMHEVARLEANLNQQEQSFAYALREQESAESEKITLADKIDFLATKIAEGEKTIADLAKDKKEIDSKLAETTNKKAEIDAKLASSKETENQKDVDALKEKIAESEAKRREIGGQIYAIRNEVASFENNRRRQEARKDSLSAEISQVKSEIANIKDEIERLESEKKSQEDAKKTLESKIEVAVGKIRQMEKELTESFSFNQEELTGLEKEVTLVMNEMRVVKASQEKSILDKFWIKLDSVFAKIGKLTNSLNQEKRTSFEARLEELRSEYRLLLDEQNKVLSELSKTTNQIEYLLQRNTGLSERLGSLEGEYKALGELKTADYSKQLKSLEENEKALVLEIDELNEKLSEASKSLAEKEHKLLAQKNLVQEEESEIRRELYELELEIGKKKSLLENQERELNSAKQKLAEITAKLSKKVVQEDDASSVALKEKKSDLEKINQQLVELRSKLTEEVGFNREQNAVLFEQEREKRGIEGEISVLKEKINIIELDKAKIETRNEDLLEELRLGEIKIAGDLKPEALNQAEKDILRARIENLKRRLETIGSVDPETVAEYEELDRRGTEMAAQVEDLEKAKTDLEKVIKELDEKIKAQFSSAFTHIAGEFNRYFQILFNGGRANLSLGEDEEGNYGIEISANPPGKRVASLNVLSGGERTLTSLALLFAILSINPSPFCFLDEVDAALDEANTIRFTKILDDLSGKTQFIIISHNRDTMKAADTLYGVTMDDDHISKLISVRLAEALETAS